MAGLRARNKLNAMRLTQRTALDLFIAQGFDNVTVADIAAVVEIAPSTLYRHFETKEAIVLWDEHDVAIDKAFETALRTLGKKSLFLTVRDVFVNEIGGRYDADLEFQLRRVQYIYATTQLHAAAVEADLNARDELAAGLSYFLKKPNRDAAPLLAGAAMLVLDVAMDRWQQGNGKKALGDLIAEGFDQLGRLDQIR